MSLLDLNFYYNLELLENDQRAYVISFLRDTIDMLSIDAYLNFEMSIY